MAYKTFMAIHTYHSQETRIALLDRLSASTVTDEEWAKSWKFEKCCCIATWVGTDDFYFCLWEAETEEDILSTLTEKGFDELIFTAFYPILMEIGGRKLSGRLPGNDMINWRTKETV